MTVRNTIRYVTHLPGKKKRDAEADAMVARLEDPNDPYRAADWAHDDNDPIGRDDNDVE